MDEQISTPFIRGNGPEVSTISSTLFKAAVSLTITAK
jgi:hypothetical protein